MGTGQAFCRTFTGQLTRRRDSSNETLAGPDWPHIFRAYEHTRSVARGPGIPQGDAMREPTELPGVYVVARYRSKHGPYGYIAVQDGEDESNGFTVVEWNAVRGPDCASEDEAMGEALRIIEDRRAPRERDPDAALEALEDR